MNINFTLIELINTLYAMNIFFNYDEILHLIIIIINYILKY